MQGCYCDDAGYLYGGETANMIAANAPLTMNAAKLAIRACTDDVAPELQVQANNAISQCGKSADFVEGRSAFLEKRFATFHGK